MWTLLPLAALADPGDGPVAPEPVAPAPAVPFGPLAPDASELPLQVQWEDRWTEVDARAVRRAQVALAVSGAFVVTTTAGIVTLGAVGYGDTELDELGYALTVGGAVGTAASIPVFLGAVGRSHRSLKEREAFTGSGAAAAAWTTYVAGLPAIAVFLEAPAFVPVWGGGVLVLGCAQARHDDRTRRAAGMPAPGVPWRLQLRPRPDGIELGGTF